MTRRSASIQFCRSCNARERTFIEGRCVVCGALAAHPSMTVDPEFCDQCQDEPMLVKIGAVNYGRRCLPNPWAREGRPAELVLSAEELLREHGLIV